MKTLRGPLNKQAAICENAPKWELVYVQRIWSAPKLFDTSQRPKSAKLAKNPLNESENIEVNFRISNDCIALNQNTVQQF